jgi:anion-transporting  ArsA/GET3 family ATPase
MSSIFFFTGKGGVGKTLLAQAFYHKLVQANPHKKVTFYSWPSTEAHNDYQTALQEYLSQKLHSSWIAHGLMRSDFFQSLLNMLPGLKYLTLLGKLIVNVQNNSNEIIIIDGPSSGHAISILQSPHSFAKMFLSGALKEDLSGIMKFLCDQNHFQVINIAIPTKLSAEESQETFDLLKQFYPAIKVVNILNQSLLKLNVSEQIMLQSQLLKRKWDEEQQISPSKFNQIIPLVITNNSAEKSSIIGELLYKEIGQS